MQRAIISTSNSNPASRLSNMADISDLPINRYPDWLSGTSCPTAADTTSRPSVFEMRLVGGIDAKSRRPITS